MLPSFLSELATVLGLASLQPDAQGACLIELVNGGAQLLFELDEQIVPHKILISAPVSSFPVERGAEIYTLCLTFNAQSEETLSVKPDEELLYLHRRLCPAIDADALKRLVERFAAQIDTAQKSVAHLLTQSPTTIPPFPYKA